MLISDSMPLLWLSYAVLSLVVLATGYMAIRILPRLPRFVVTGMVAGLLWTPAGFTLPMAEGEAPYQGVAPVVMVIAVAVLQHNGSAFAAALPLLVLGCGVGVAIGVMLWAKLPSRSRRSDQENNNNAKSADKPSRNSLRREPTIGG